MAESAHGRFFPYDAPYENQREAISGVYDALVLVGRVIREKASVSGFGHYRFFDVSGYKTSLLVA